MARLNRGYVFSGHHTSGYSSPSTITGTLKRGPREGVTGVSGADVRVLCEEGKLKEALHILDNQCIQRDSKTFVSLLQACMNMKALAEGKQVHAHIIRSELMSNIVVVSTLVNMYAKCGSMVDARHVFEEMPQRNIVSWTIMIAGYAKHGQAEEAFRIYSQMQREGVMANRITFICILNACASLRALEKGKQVHANIIKAGILPYINLENTLIDMYAKCGSLRDAREVFDKMTNRDVISWNTMLTGYAQHGRAEEFLKFYEQMQREGVTPDMVTFICILNVYGNLGTLEKGKQVHADIIKAGITPTIILETTLIDMYAKCGSLKDAQELFDKMATSNVVSWNAMIAGYAQHGCGEEALKLYKKMQQEGVTPTRVTFICVLNACASLGVLEKGKTVHADIIQAGVGSYMNLENTLVNMYAKCGSLKDAREVFAKMANRDVVSWNVIIAGYAQHGCGREALQLFDQMLSEGLKPDGLTFISVISACSHVGLLDEGRHYFHSMSGYHGLTPTVEHFGCMVDLLGRAGLLEEAEDIINRMPMEPNDSVWGALLGACRIHGDVEVGKRAAKFILKWVPQHTGAYVLLSNIYGKQCLMSTIPVLIPPASAPDKGAQS